MIMQQCLTTRHYARHGVYNTILLENITHNGLVYANTMTLVHKHKFIAHVTWNACIIHK